MEEIQQAIYNKFNSDSDLKNSVTGLYFTEAPQDTEFPYIVFSKPSGIAEYSFTDKFENTLWQFTILSDASSASEINDIFSKLTACFDLATLTVSGWTNYWCVREMDYLERIDKVWHWYVRYRIRITKTR